MEANSIGIAQIYLKYHPEVSRENAEDPQFSMAFMARRFRDGYANEWTCFRMYFPGEDPVIPRKPDFEKMA